MSMDGACRSTGCTGQKIFPHSERSRSALQQIGNHWTLSKLLHYLHSFGSNVTIEHLVSISCPHIAAFLDVTNWDDVAREYSMTLRDAESLWLTSMQKRLHVRLLEDYKNEPYRDTQSEVSSPHLDNVCPQKDRNQHKNDDLLLSSLEPPSPRQDNALTELWMNIPSDVVAIARYLLDPIRWTETEMIQSVRTLRKKIQSDVTAHFLSMGKECTFSGAFPEHCIVGLSVEPSCEGTSKRAGIRIQWQNLSQDRLCSSERKDKTFTSSNHFQKCEVTQIRGTHTIEWLHSLHRECTQIGQRAKSEDDYLKPIEQTTQSPSSWKSIHHPLFSDCKERTCTLKFSIPVQDASVLAQLGLRQRYQAACAIQRDARDYITTKYLEQLGNVGRQLIDLKLSDMAVDVFSSSNVATVEVCINHLNNEDREWLHMLACRPVGEHPIVLRHLHAALGTIKHTHLSHDGNRKHHEPRFDSHSHNIAGDTTSDVRLVTYQIIPGDGKDGITRDLKMKSRGRVRIGVQPHSLQDTSRSYQRILMTDSKVGEKETSSRGCILDGSVPRRDLFSPTLKDSTRMQNRSNPWNHKGVLPSRSSPNMAPQWSCSVSMPNSRHDLPLLVRYEKL